MTIREFFYTYGYFEKDDLSMELINDKVVSKPKMKKFELQIIDLLYKKIVKFFPKEQYLYCLEENIKFKDSLVVPALCLMNEGCFEVYDKYIEGLAEMIIDFTGANNFYLRFDFYRSLCIPYIIIIDKPMDVIRVFTLEGRRYKEDITKGFISKNFVF